MKKTFIVIFILLIIAGGFGWYYYDKNIRFGAPINEREVPANEGYHFDGAVGEKSMVFWNFNGNFGVNLANFPDTENAVKSFDAKKKGYLASAPLNNEIVTEKEISGHYAFIVLLGGNSRLIVVQVNDKIAHITNSDRSEQEMEKFAKWFIRYKL